MYQVYSITTPDNKYRYYGTSSNVARRMYKHQYRLRGGNGGYCYLYEKLRESVDSIYECKIKVVESFKNKNSALKMEQQMIEKNGNLNSRNAIA